MTRRRPRGFTLVELMVVVVIVGVLAALGVAGLRSYVIRSRAAEATAMIQAIRAAQERFRSESGAYLDVSADQNDWWPRRSQLDGTLVSFRVAAPDATGRRWELLAVQAPGQGVRFVYTTRAGPPGVAIGTAAPMANPAAAGAFSTSVLANQNWYVIEARGDADGDGDEVFLSAASFNALVVTGGSD